MMNRLEDEEMPDLSEFIQSRNSVDFISSSMMLSAVDSKATDGDGFREDADRHSGAAEEGCMTILLWILAIARNIDD